MVIANHTAPFESNPTQPPPSPPLKTLDSICYGGGIRDDIKWLLSKVDKLADQRNDAIHAPLALTSSDAFVGVEVMAAYFDGNPRAIKLKDKDILAELRWYRESAEVLRSYALSLWFSLGHPDRSLPQRPEMPLLGQSQSQRRSRLRSPAK